MIYKNNFYSLQTPNNYPENRGCYEVVWHDLFMPFDIIRGLGSCPPDNKDYDKYKKTHWWVCPKTYHDICNVHDISVFIRGLPTKEFRSLDSAIKFCFKWRNEWLNNQLSI
jgi:hypothetical protein